MKKKDHKEAPITKILSQPYSSWLAWRFFIQKGVLNDLYSGTTFELYDFIVKGDIFPVLVQWR